MFVARILYPVEVLGPGKRIGIWLSGCTRECKGCSNPELWEHRKEQEISVSRLDVLLHRLAQDQSIDGMTITGGEPMDQAGELSELLPLLSDLTTDFLLYSGYTLEELHARMEPAIENVLHQIAVLIDGEYREELNSGLPLRGSSNQRIHIFNDMYQSKYAQYLKSENKVQNFFLGDSIVSAGIHRSDYQMKLNNAAVSGLIARYIFRAFSTSSFTVPIGTALPSGNFRPSS